MAGEGGGEGPLGVRPGGRSQRVLPQGSSSWEAADLGNEERKQKFLRLMGAGKVRPPRAHGDGAGGSSPPPSPGGCAAFSVCDAANPPREEARCGPQGSPGTKAALEGDFALGLSFKEDLGFTAAAVTSVAVCCKTRV